MYTRFLLITLLAPVLLPAQEPGDRPVGAGRADGGAGRRFGAVPPGDRVGQVGTRLDTQDAFGRRLPRELHRHRFLHQWHLGDTDVRQVAAQHNPSVNLPFGSGGGARLARAETKRPERVRQSLRTAREDWEFAVKGPDRRPLVPSAYKGPIWKWRPSAS